MISDQCHPEVVIASPSNLFLPLTRPFVCALLNERTTSPTRGEVSLHHNLYSYFLPKTNIKQYGKNTSPLVGEVGLLRCGAEAKVRVRGIKHYQQFGIVIYWEEGGRKE